MIRKNFFGGYVVEDVEKHLEELKAEYNAKVRELEDMVLKLDDEKQALMEEVERLKAENAIAVDTIVEAQKEAQAIRGEAIKENEVILQNAKKAAGKFIDYSRQGTEIINSITGDIEHISKRLVIEEEENAVIEIPGGQTLDLTGVIRCEPKPEPDQQQAEAFREAISQEKIKDLQDSVEDAEQNLQSRIAEQEKDNQRVEKLSELIMNNPELSPSEMVDEILKSLRK